MSSELQIEDVFIQVKDKLQKDGIKLWLQPYYYANSGTSEADLNRLAEDYSANLTIQYESCYAALSELQTNALENLKYRDRFRESGLATLKIKICNQSSPRLITKEILLSALCSDLKSDISSQIQVATDKIKLISAGKVLKDDENLSNQDIKNGQQILALILLESPLEAKESLSKFQEVEGFKADTKLLASDDFYMQLEDQAGNPINIPYKEKKALMVAIALHEKGRTALKRENYARALVFFLDADREFNRCNSQILQMVDNYALLNLDIAWCYLCLQSVSHLPEASDRLKKCEEKFHKSYGPNLERLIALKGAPGNEAVLFMRLHLLQAIVLFHQNKRMESLQLFQRVEKELQVLKVNEESILSLVELGYSTAESRLGLRATRGDVNSAAVYINENREKRNDARKKALAEQILKREQKKLGKCVDGKQFVSPEYVKMLVNMGYNKEVARIALKNTNNIISESIQYIQENPQAGPSGTKSQEILSLINDLIPELEAAGFDARMAKLALVNNNADIMKAAEELLAKGGIIDGDLAGLEDEIHAKIDEKQKMKEDALLRLQQDIPMVDDDHLDITLQQEEIFLRQYLSLLKED